jgi:uncharacterized protein
MPQQSQARNQLESALSPYLLQHASNPVHWRQWSNEAFDEARKSEKPILLSIGYAACHWCHVMAHESFENSAIADQMNKNFVNIKVDREERPDIDQIYMMALQAMGEHGGWPLTMFLDHDGKPFWGGTYFPPEPRYGRAGFPDILNAISKAWREEPEQIATNGNALARYLQEAARPQNADAIPDKQSVMQFQDLILSLCDPANGGIGSAPKFPNAPMLDTLLRSACARPEPQYRAAFLQAIEKMSMGGIYDQIGGGLSRYSVDEKWLIPHFEKMLYDNAHYISHLCRAYQLQPDNLYRQRLEQTIEWLEREMLLPQQAFAASLDADSEGEEGKFYVWTIDQIRDCLGTDAEFFCQHFDISADGNFEGKNILNRLHARSLSNAEEQKIKELSEKLLSCREKRPRPARDDKILTDWNGYMISSLAVAASIFDRQDWLDMAHSAYRFIKENIGSNNMLAHGWNRNQPIFPAMASDYAAMIKAALDLAEITGQNDYVADATNWLATLDRDYSDGQGGYFLTSIKAGELIARPRCDIDDPNPSPAATLIESLVRLAAFANDTKLLNKAWKLAANQYGATSNNRFGIAGLYNALDTLYRHRHVLLLADEPEDLTPFIEQVRRIPDPAISIKRVTGTGQPDNYLGIELSNQTDRPAAIICSRQTCSLPITDKQKFSEMIQNSV